MKSTKTILGVGAALLIIVLALYFFKCLSLKEGGDPGSVSSDHFIATYSENRDYAVEILNTAEKHYKRIVNEFGFDDAIKEGSLGLWAWDRCEIYLHNNGDAKLNGAGPISGPLSTLDIRKRRINVREGDSDFADSLLSGHIARILFWEFVGFENPHIPAWLDEGVAGYANFSKREFWPLNMQYIIKNGSHIPLFDISAFELSEIDSQAARFFSEQSASIVYFMLEKYGRRQFLDLCARLRDRMSLSTALGALVNSDRLTLGEFETAWLAFISAYEPKPKKEIEVAGKEIEENPEPEVEATKEEESVVSERQPAMDERKEEWSVITAGRPVVANDPALSTPAPRPREIQSAAQRRGEFDEASQLGEQPEISGETTPLPGLFKDSIMPLIGSRAPSFNIETVTGQLFSLEKYSGNAPVLIHFWSIYSSPSLKQLRRIVEIQKRYADQNLGVVGISLDIFASKRVASFLKGLEYTVPYPVAVDKLRDPAAKYGIKQTPTIVLINVDGNISHYQIGYDEENLEEMEEAILNAFLPSGW